MELDLKNLKNVYFIGVGGIGMSALARYFNQRGICVNGYDKTKTTLTEKLVDEGIGIHYEEDIARIPRDLDLVVYTPAIPSDHKELKLLQNSSIPVLKRSEVLGLISRNKKCVAVAGTHGKTTTSSMLAYLLKNAGIDASCFLGGIAKNFDSNFVNGSSDWVVIEADEFDRSFHRLFPKIAILISMDADHLDIYDDKTAMQASFEQFLMNVNPKGIVLVQYNVWEQVSKGTKDSLKRKEINCFTYGFRQGDFQLGNLSHGGAGSSFEWKFGNRKEKISTKMAGKHNALNMCAALSVGYLLGADKKKLFSASNEFDGIKRRFELIYHSDVMVYIDDYAHHPSEIRAVIETARAKWNEKEITVVFQPHLYSRTKDFMEEFALELAKVDKIILLDIYPAREKPIPGIKSSVLLEKIQLDQKVLLKKEELITYLSKEKIEVLMTLGAGDIDVFVPQIEELLSVND